MTRSELVLLAAGTNVGNPEQERRAAQIVGLSLALDPTNREGLDLAKSLKNGKSLDDANANEVNQAKSRAWHLLSWLEQPEAGTDGNALADCLGDILKGVDPEHPRAADLAGKSEQGKWEGWVASVSAFEESKTEMAEETVETPEEPSNSNSSIALKLKTASVYVPLWHEDKVTKKMVLRPVTINMEAKINGENEKVEVNLPNSDLEKLQSTIGGKLKEILAKRYGEVPKGLQFKFDLAGDLKYSESRNGNVMLGAIVVLADASLSGRPPTGMVFADVDADGKLKVPRRFWQTVRTLADYEPGSRLVIPSVTKDYMPALITLDKSDFFINFEVMMANDVTGLCELASSAPPERIETAHEIFETIRKARGTRSLGSFISHESTQQRLKQVIGLFPDHVSARMLALRGTSQWPKRLPRDIYAREIRATIQPLGSFFTSNGWMKIDAADFLAKLEESREQLDEVEKLFGSVGDRQELHTPAMNLTKALSGFATDAKRSSEFERYELQSAYNAAWKDYNGMIQLLTLNAGDQEDYPAPPAVPTP